MTDEEREEWPCLQHGQCKHFSVNSDRQESTCKRLDHKHFKFAHPWFKSYDCGQMSGQICKEFEPMEFYKWLYDHWDGIDGYFGKDYKPNGTVWLTIDGDTSVRYGVPYEKFWEGNFLNEDGSLNWEKKMYYKRVRKDCGYRLVTEMRDEDND